MIQLYNHPSLEKRLLSSDSLTERIHSDRNFAKALYAALCNNAFRHESSKSIDDYWSCSWRYAGGVVAQIEDLGGNYMDYYCSGNEGKITPEIHELLASLGWSVVPIPDDDKP